MSPATCREEPQDHKGPSDAQAEGGRDTNRETKGGVDANATKGHLMDVAKRLDISGRSRMSKDELVDAIQKVNDKETAEARKGELVPNLPGGGPAILPT